MSKKEAVMAPNVDGWVDGDQASGAEPEALPAYPLELDSAPRRRSPGAVGRTIGVLIVSLFAVSGAIFAVNHRSSVGADRDRVKNPDQTTPIPDPIGLGSPIDGKASLLLPVRVFPDHDLVEGQDVTVVGTNFRPNVQVGAVICTNAAQTKGAAACDIGQVVAFGQTDSVGRVSIPYKVRRFATIAGQPFDCLQGNVDPTQYEQYLRAGRIPATPAAGWSTCILVIGQVDDYDQSGGWPFALQGQVFRNMDEAPAPTTTVAPDPTEAPPVTDAPVAGATTPTTAPAGPNTTVPPTPAPTSAVAPPGTVAATVAPPTTGERG